MKNYINIFHARTISVSRTHNNYSINIYIIFVIIFLLFFPFQILKAQNPTGSPNYQGTLFNYGHLMTIPPLTTDMPFDVMIGYIGLDSVRKNVEYLNLQEFLARQSYNDTIRTIMKYYYKVVDWNPMIFTAYKKNTESGMIQPSMIIDEISQKYLELAPTIGNCLVATSDFIYHIRVIDTTRFFDSTSNTFQRGLKCYSEILDIFKGKPVNSPCFSNQNSLKYEDSKIQNKMLSDTNFLFCFDIRLDWHRGNDPGDIVVIGSDNYPWTGIKEKLVDSADKPWVTANSDYIIFLNTVLIDYGDTYNTYQLFPNGCNSLTNGIYPIINGVVQDPSNDFELGTSVPFNIFIQKMILTIDSIKNYTN